LDLHYKLERGTGSKLKPAKDRKCVHCEEKEASAKIECLKRVLSDEASTSYQKKSNQ